MTTRFYIDAQGHYLGAFDSGDSTESHPNVPQDAVEVPSPPEYASQIWDGSSWGDPIPPPITVAASSAKLVLDDDGLYLTVETMCLSHPVQAVRIFWESANTWVENNPYVLAIGLELALTEAQMHDKFERALLK